MTRFAVCFLLILGQLSFGGMLAMAIPPFFEVERGFYKSSASVYLSAAALSAIGLGFLAARGSQPGSPSAAVLWWAATIWLLFCVACAIYLATLWTDNGRLRARSYSLGLLIGLAAVLFSSLLLKPASLGVVADAGYGLMAVASSLVLGLASVAMLFGHWYLIDPNLPVDFLRRLVRIFRASLIAEIVAVAIVLAGFVLLGNPQTSAAVVTLFHADLGLLAMRVMLGPVASLLLAWMVWQTLKIPHTMAATGLLYITVLSVLVGELLGRFILFRTALPL